MKRNRLPSAATALAVTPGIALLLALTAAGPANAATTPTCTGTSLVTDVFGTNQVRVPTVGNATGRVDCQLQLGDDNRSVAVMRLQIALNECDAFDAGFPPLAVDGDYGQNTYNAVRLTQAFWHVHVDGIYGPQTRRGMSWPAAGSNGNFCTEVH
jgi:peptidoglycan hydrolase-like protein with peptidoglycan-binding domain